MKYIIRNYPVAFIKWAIYGILLLIAKLVAILIAPILALWSVLAGISVLPYPFSLFHTHDDDLDGGQHQLAWPRAKGLKLWWQRTRWIMRNPAYGFAANVFGFRFEGVTTLYQIDSGGFDWSKPGTFYEGVYRDRKGRLFFSYRARFKIFGKICGCWIGWSYVAYDNVSLQLKISLISIVK